MVYTLEQFIQDGKNNNFTPEQLDGINKQRMQKWGRGVPGWEEFYTAYQQQAPQEEGTTEPNADTTNALPGIIGVPVAAAGAGAAYSMLKPPSARRVNNLRAFVNNMVINAFGNISPKALDEKTDDVIKLVKNMDRDTIKRIGKEGFRGLYDYVGEKLEEVGGERGKVIQANKGAKIGLEAMQPLADEIQTAKEVGDSTKATALQRTYDDVIGLFGKKGYITLDQAEKVKEAYYAKHKGWDKLDSAGVSRADIETDIAYKKVGQGMKTAMEDVTKAEGVAGESPLKVWNNAYGSLKDLQKGLAKTTVKAAKSETPSALARTAKKGLDVIRQVPGSQLALPKGPTISNIKAQEGELGSVLSNIKRRGDRMIKGAASLSDEAAEVINTVSNSPLAKKIGSVGGKVLGTAGKVLGAFDGIVNPLDLMIPGVGLDAQQSMIEGNRVF